MNFRTFIRLSLSRVSLFIINCWFRTSIERPSIYLRFIQLRFVPFTNRYFSANPGYLFSANVLSLRASTNSQRYHCSPSNPYPSFHSQANFDPSPFPTARFSNGNIWTNSTFHQIVKLYLVYSKLLWYISKPKYKCKIYRCLCTWRLFFRSVVSWGYVLYTL